MEQLEGKVAVVTGGASGIGLALGRAFAGAGMAVVLADIESGPLDQATATFGPGDVLGVVTDVRDPDAVEALADAAIERFGAVHVICNNAGVVSGGLSWEIDADRWRWVVDVNLLGVANGVRAFVPRFIAQGEGHVVNTASAAGLITGPGMAPYFATKHAVVALSESLRFELELTGHPVGVTVICPEWVKTRIGEAERNLPEGVAPRPESDDPASSFFRDMVVGFVDGGMDPADVADLVVDAVRTGGFWVLPHPTTLGLAETRWSAIAEGRAPGLPGA